MGNKHELKIVEKKRDVVLDKNAAHTLNRKRNKEVLRLRNITKLVKAKQNNIQNSLPKTRKVTKEVHEAGFQSSLSNLACSCDCLHFAGRMKCVSWRISCMLLVLIVSIFYLAMSQLLNWPEQALDCHLIVYKAYLHITQQINLTSLIHWYGFIFWAMISKTAHGEGKKHTTNYTFIKELNLKWIPSREILYQRS